MIYDPSRRAQELRRRILESITADVLEEYAKQLADRGTPPADSEMPTPSEEP